MMLWLSVPEHRLTWQLARVNAYRTELDEMEFVIFLRGCDSDIPKAMSLSRRYAEVTGRTLSKFYILHSISDRGVADVCAYGAIREITISGHRISDLALSHLAKVPELHKLSLAGGCFSASGFRQLHQCESLNRLSIDSDDVLLTDDCSSAADGFRWMKPDMRESLRQDFKKCWRCETCPAAPRVSKE
jgi:hypothetical protein